MASKQTNLYFFTDVSPLSSVCCPFVGSMVAGCYSRNNYKFLHRTMRDDSVMCFTSRLVDSISISDDRWINSCFFCESLFWFWNYTVFNCGVLQGHVYVGIRSPIKIIRWLSSKRGGSTWLTNRMI